MQFTRFKQFEQASFNFRPSDVTFLAGGNNSGKSSILHGLAVWEFCKIASLMERGEDAFLAVAEGRQGFGLGDDEFSPINLPSLKHLWTNLKTAKGESDPDGYTLKIRCEWDGAAEEKHLEFALSLANDRLFIKPVASNLQAGDRVPTAALLPPFAGISAREARIVGALRRRRIGEGLAGAVLRNLLLDMYQENLRERERLRGGKSKISDSDLRRLRESDPWELIQDALRRTFSAELIIGEFREEYHSYINVQVAKGDVEGYKLTRWPKYNPKDLMVEGSGFLQWLSVFTLATADDVDVLLLDEPDAHLHPTLQAQMVEQLETLASRKNKQVLLATHSSEILKTVDHRKIFQARRGRSGYLQEDHQKVGLLAGIGSDYAPKLDRVRKTKRILFIEGTSDLSVLKAFSEVLGIEWRTTWVPWHSTASQKERAHIFRAIADEVPGLVAYSLRDRDDEILKTVGPALEDKNVNPAPNFMARKWRRRYIEGYLIYPRALAEAAGLSEGEVADILRDEFGIAIGDSFRQTEAPSAILDMRAKEVLKKLKVPAAAVASSFQADEVCDDIVTVLKELDAHAE
ncbi:AAA family ATPase [Streptomyces sp. DH37]|uniref:AAA family ATPase n=1 Tax=Streptomyces sp. DH37 TaxID=3040122 RepID=UPI002442152A|nr:AAA family ATPase [Streptomyces sp. DH37]MDG9701832.1 AAA family ATPase [Streptomyces sp. DH37]